MPNIIDEYLVKLGTTVDQVGLRRFEQGMKHMKGVTEFNMASMSKATLKASGEIVAGFAAIGGAAVTLMDRVANADQEYRLFALHMFMSKDAARSLKVAMDALGQPLENLWWDAELSRRTNQLIEDQRRMAPGADYDEQMRKIRDIRFEFTRMQVELQYLTMNVVSNFMKALGMGPDTLLERLRKFNDWIIQHMPQISEWIATNFLPIWNDVKMVMTDVWQVTKDLLNLFTNIVGLFSGDTGLQSATFDMDKFAKAVQTVVHWLAMFVHIVSKIFGFLGGAAIGGTAGGAIAGTIGMVTAGPAGALALAPIGTAIGGGVGGIAGGIWDIWRHLHPAGTPAGDAIGPPPGAAGAGSVVPGNVSGMTPDIVNAMIGAESSGNRYARSNRGAGGLMQLMPATARAMGVTDVYDPEQNVAGGTKYMNQLLAKYNGNLAYALAAYNAGPGQVDKILSGKQNRFADPNRPMETEDYVGKILGRLGQSGDVSIGAVTIHIQEPRAGHKEIVRAVSDGVQEAMNKKTQRNLQEFQSQAWSY